MILAASIITRNELSRYLPLVVEHLRSYADQITILDDNSTDGTFGWLQNQADDQLTVALNSGDSFDQHEGHARQRLLEVTLARKPTHVLAIDADELVGDGWALRAAVEADPAVAAWTLQMTEVWDAGEEALHVRLDGGWRPYARTHLWRVPENLGGGWRIADRKLACPPVPVMVLQTRARGSGQTIYHFGWADPSTRRARYERYMHIDNGQFHSRRHLESIMAPPHLIRLQPQPWPTASWAPHVREKLSA